MTRDNFYESVRTTFYSTRWTKMADQIKKTVGSSVNTIMGTLLIINIVVATRLTQHNTLYTYTIVANDESEVQRQTRQFKD